MESDADVVERQRSEMEKRWDAIAIIYRRGKIIPCPLVLAANNLNSRACLFACTAMAAERR